MSLETARDLSIQDLLHVLGEKFGLERTRIQKTFTPPVVSAASLESEVSTRWPILIAKIPATRLDGQSFRSKAWKPEPAMF